MRLHAVCLGLLILSATLRAADAVASDPNVGEKVTKGPLTGFSSKDEGGFDGKVFVMAVHEAHPFVFFDCDEE